MLKLRTMMMLKNNSPITESLSPLIVRDEFPFEFISAVAERESWRKEVYRPIYHMHKWWAKRLGSVFRGILLGGLLPEQADLEMEFYKKHDFRGVTVFDPFMGGGTTIGEAHKLGCTALGRDINPVACEAVRVALGKLDRHDLQNAFSRLNATVGGRIEGLYRSSDQTGQMSDVLYYFWVKQVTSPCCSAEVDLFSTRIIARNAYPDRKPEVQVCCPGCGDIFPSLSYEVLVQCRACQLKFDPHTGSAAGTKAICPQCANSFSIAAAVRAFHRPPAHRLYGKLLLTSTGDKKYLPATEEDLAAYRNCTLVLRQEVESGAIRLPVAELADGFNTRQAIGYNYRCWRDFFNDRQLLALGWLQQAIAELTDESARDALLLLFSGTLEFNNLFASYKGEGTGAVRHMFSHHILKPERMPIEANVWGTPKSSGSFSTLYETRLLRALDYRVAPFEVKAKANGNVSGRTYYSSPSFSGEVSIDWPKDGCFQPRGIYLSCGSSDQTALPDKSLDMVVTDPPFFDNVHYSELADFFHAWQKFFPRGFLGNATTTRHEREVQDRDAESFAGKLMAVLAECNRILKDDGLLIFTYHHSRPEGWTSLAKAVFGSGFSVINAHPVKSELSVAAPKSQAKEPIQLDMIFVCKKREEDLRDVPALDQALADAAVKSKRKLLRLNSVGLRLSRNDRLVTFFSQFFSALGPVSADVATRSLLHQKNKLEELSDLYFESAEDIMRKEPDSTPAQPRQLSLL
ncbi:MAG: DNA methyltransferase [Blastocatellia bacterium]